MTWLKIDDGFHCHPKVEAVGNAAAGLYVRCLAYCSQHSTDGFVPDSIAKRYGTGTQIARVSAANLWRKVDGGYMVDDFLDFNPSAEKVQRIRKERAEAGRLGGIKSGETRRSKSEANASGLVEPRPVPSRPVPSTTTSSKGSSSSHREPDDDESVDNYEVVANHLASLKTDAAKPESRKRYLAVVRQNIDAEEGAEIRRLLELFPDAPVSALSAAVMSGDTRPLAPYARQETA